MKKIITFLAIAALLMVTGCKNNSKAPAIDVNTVDTTVVYEDSTWTVDDESSPIDCSCADEDSTFIGDELVSTVVDSDSLAENIADGLAELVLLTLDEE